MFLRPASMALVCGLALTPLSALAEVTTYGGAHTGMLDFDTGDVSFRPWLAGLHGGVLMENGVGAELVLSTSVSDDEQDRTEMSLNYGAQGYLVYTAYEQYGTREQGAGALTLGLGYSFLDTNVDAGSSGFPGDQSWDGPALMVRLQERLDSAPSVVLKLSYEHIFLDDDLSARQYTLGVSYEF